MTEGSWHKQCASYRTRCKQPEPPEVVASSMCFYQLFPFPTRDVFQEKEPGKTTKFIKHLTGLQFWRLVCLASGSKGSGNVKGKIAKLSRRLLKR
eukprot:1650235-Amphidinium_carterae.1